MARNRDGEKSIVRIAVLGLSRRGSRGRVCAGYRGNRGLHKNLRSGQANGVPSEQRQFFAAARDKECARLPTEAGRGRRRDRRAQKRRDPPAKDRGAASSRAEGGWRQKAGDQVAEGGF